MEINKEIDDILKEFKIHKDAGKLVLLGIYFKLDIESVCPEEVIKAINTTKIVEKDYNSKLIKWNVPLFTTQQTEWTWVEEWNNKWRVNPSRKASNGDVLKRMQEWFSKYPKYRKSDVIQATTLYFSQTHPDYLKNSAAFIFDGAGAMKKSILLGWCEKLKDTGSDTSQQRGEVIK